MHEPMMVGFCRLPEFRPYLAQAGITRRVLARQHSTLASHRPQAPTKESACEGVTRRHPRRRSELCWRVRANRQTPPAHLADPDRGLLANA